MRSNFDKYRPVISITFKGKVLIFIIRLVYLLRKWIGRPQWDEIVSAHHEDPLKMTFAEKVYMGHKYYYKAMVKSEANSGLKEHFKNQSLQFHIPGGFIPQQSFTLGAGGDLIPYECVNTETCKNLWDDVGSFLFGNDLVFANLETPVDTSMTKSAAPEIMLHDMYFNADEETFSIFSGLGKYKGYDVLSIANNHSLDMGMKGLINTMHFLRSKNIEFTGAAPNEAATHSFPIIERNGINTAFLSYTYSLNKEELPEDAKWLCNHVPLNETNPDISLIVQQAAIARQKGADIIVALLHIGCAYQAYPSMHTVQNIRNICTHTGIDIILASHPHNAQPIEIFTSHAKQHLIVYSPGDLVGYDIFKWCHLSLLLKITVTKGRIGNKVHTLISRLEVMPVYMHAEAVKGRIKSLQLRNYYNLAEAPENFFTKKKDLEKFLEIQMFFNEFINMPLKTNTGKYSLVQVEEE